MKIDIKDLKYLTYEDKIRIAKNNIKEWYEYWEGKVHVAFSGGKDSVVLLHIVRSLYPEVKGMFINTGLEYPEIVEFVKTIKNIDWITPKISFKEVIEKHGYPIISKEISSWIYEVRNTNKESVKLRRMSNNKNKYGSIPGRWRFLINAPFKISDKCCGIMKKKPALLYEKEKGTKPFLGLRSGDSKNREYRWKKNGCNMYQHSQPQSWPLGVWSEDDIWKYIKDNKLQYSKIYDNGIDRTGCMFCMFGIHCEKKNRFEIMKKNNYKLFRYCMDKLKIKSVLEYIYSEGENQLFRDERIKNYEVKNE